MNFPSMFMLFWCQKKDKTSTDDVIFRSGAGSVECTVEPRLPQTEELLQSSSWNFNTEVAALFRTLIWFQEKKSNYWLSIARDIVCCLTSWGLFMYELMQIVSNILSKSTVNIFVSFSCLWLKKLDCYQTEYR